MSNFLSDKTILVPYDFSVQAGAAIKEALSMATESTKVVVLNVLVAPHVITSEPGMLVALENEKDRMAVALDGMKSRISDPNNRIEFAARVGDPGLEIVDYAKGIKADLIVMPSHGRTGIKRLLLGSVAERVVRMAECPVMVLRGPKRE